MVASLLHRSGRKSKAGWTLMYKCKAGPSCRCNSPTDKWDNITYMLHLQKNANSANHSLTMKIGVSRDDYNFGSIRRT
eukprot:6004127-Pleurochrysis_carterae.AAC.1